jgi:general secretion pathway protein H
LVLVIVIVGIVLYIAAPKVRDDILNDSLRASVRQFVGLAKELRQDAVREQIDYILHVDVGANRYWIETSDMTPEKRDERHHGAVPFSADVRLTDIELSDDRTKTEGEVMIIFSRQGFVQPAVFHLTKGEKVMTICLSPFLHEVKTYDKVVTYKELFAAP